MPTVDELQAELGLDPDLVLEFVLAFSRLDYALKRVPAYARARQNGSAEANWTQFSDDHGADFDLDASEDLAEACRYLEENPPGRQVLSQADGLTYETPARNGQSDLKWAIRNVKAARNNLFHGGKFPLPVGPVEDPGLNTILLNHCLTVIRHLKGLDPRVEDAYDSRLR